MKIMQWTFISGEQRRAQELCVVREFPSFHPKIAQTCPIPSVSKQENEDTTPHPQLNVCKSQILPVGPEIENFPEMGAAGGSWMWHWNQELPGALMARSALPDKNNLGSISSPGGDLLFPPSFNSP